MTNKPYKIRLVGNNKVISIPPHVLEQEAKKRSLSVEAFIERFYAVAKYDKGKLTYSFVEME